MSDSQQTLSEFDIISRFFHKPSRDPTIIKTIGDDCAILSVPTGMRLALSMDTLVAERHFPNTATPTQIAQRAFCTCLSDLAAMGAAAKYFTLSLSLPDANTEWLHEFSHALLAIAEQFDCELIGGDTTQGPLTITLQVHGHLPEGKALTRDAAKLGDRVFVTGHLGDGRAALDIILDGQVLNTKAHDYLLERFYRPEPQLRAGLKLLDIANAAIDVSDGLLADLNHIANASEVRIEIDLDAIPISSACRAVANDRAIEYALSGGDDYQLLFTVPESNCPTLKQLIANKELQASEIGRVVSEKVSGEGTPRIICTQGGAAIELDTHKGYQHFVA